jgi:probable HAF family extracellular repeat protein
LEWAELIQLNQGVANVNGFASGINNLDQVIGFEIEPGSLIRRAFLWENGLVTYLGSLGDLGDSIAYDINDNGQIVGQSQIGPDQFHAFLWEGGVIEDLGTLGGEFSIASAINSLPYISLVNILR